MNVVEQEARARRREVGRTLLTLGRALSATLTIFNRTKEDPRAREAAREACDEALREMRKSFEALWQLRRSLDRPGMDAEPRLSRPSVAH
jgi:hypothetical protein